MPCSASDQSRACADPHLGTAIQIAPGDQNKGIFVKLSAPSPGAGEEYQITHPLAQVNGLLKGSYYGTVSDKVYVTCRAGKGAVKYRTIIEYKDEVCGLVAGVGETS